MASVNVLDFSAFVRSYIIFKIKESIPDLDTSDNSAFDDLFVKPMLQILPPFSDTVSSLEYKMNLDNAANMTTADMDEIGNGNFLMPRLSGTKAIATLTLSYLKIDPNSNLTIATGTTFTTDSGLQYQTTQQYVFTPTELMTKYNVARTTYDVVISVEAVETGIAYNVSENQIKNALDKLGPTLSTISNKIPVTSGVDSETNADYALRIREYYVSRQLGTKPGYSQFIFQNFPEIEDLYIAGFGDIEMERDLVDIIKNGSPTTMHIGGKVDIYVKGCVFSSNTATLVLNTERLPLAQPYSLIDPMSITIDNLTDNVKVPAGYLTMAPPDMAQLALDNTGEISYDPTITSQIKVTYEYTGGLAPVEETFTVGWSSVDLVVPFKSIVLVYETNNDTIIYSDSHYELLRYGPDGTPILDPSDTYYGTTKESVKFHWLYLNGVVNGTSITISYTTNKTLSGLRDIFDLTENRIITTDLLFKEVPAKYINVGFSVKLRSGQTLDDVKIANLNNVLNNYFNLLGLGSRVDESDLVGALYKDGSVNTFIEYILLPLDSFYSPMDPALDMELIRDGTFIETTNLEYPALNKVAITEIL